MRTLLSQAPARTRINFSLFALFLGVALLFGGASRADVLSLPLVRLAAITLLAIVAIQLNRDDWRAIRMPALFLIAASAVIAVQLIPLPPGLWSSLPGRSFYLDAMAAAGVDGEWRSLSLTPDLTLNALLAMLPPLAAVAALGIIDRAFQRALVPLLLIGIALSAVIGLIQMSSGTPYFYAVTNTGAAVGFFSNRNHLAVLIALALPLLACWTTLPHPDPSYRRLRSWLALCMAAAIFPLLLATGSRAGLGLGAVGAVAALAIRMGAHRGRGGGMIARVRQTPLLALLPLAIGALAVFAAVILSRDVALRRLLADNDMDVRANHLPTYVEMARDYFPTGSGFGSFDSVFRTYEPVQTLTPEYMNQAHNDLAQLAIEGGVPALLLLALFLIWFVVRSWRLWWHKPHSSQDFLGRTGSVMVVLILASSLVDYPLRTPMLSVVMALACFWMLPNRASGQGEIEAKDGVGSPGGLE